MKSCDAPWPVVNVVLGDSATTSARFVAPCSASLEPLSTVIAAGVVSRMVRRFSAVIVTRSSCAESAAGALAAAAGAAAVCACASSGTPASSAPAQSSAT